MPAGRPRQPGAGASRAACAPRRRCSPCLEAQIAVAIVSGSSYLRVEVPLRTATATTCAMTAIAGSFMGLAGSAGASVRPLENPVGNLALPTLATSTGPCAYSAGGRVKCPSPCFPAGRIVYNASPACTRLVLSALNGAQAAEHHAGFTLPSNYFSFGPAAQMFVLVNLERISHGVPPLIGLSPYLDAAAAAAAGQARDPVNQPSYGPVKVWFPPHGGLYAYGGAWAGDSVNAAAAVFDWFYNDGWGGKAKTWNFACTSASAPGCWGHRDELLGVWAGTSCNDCVAGAAFASDTAGNWLESYAFLLVRPAAFPTPLIFTWDRNVVPYLPKGWERAKAP